MRNHGLSYKLDLELVMFGWMIPVDFAMVWKWTWNNKDISPNMEDKRMVERDRVWSGKMFFFFSFWVD